jgi:hypothetical protein
MEIRRVYKGQAVKAEDINNARIAGESARITGVTGAGVTMGLGGTALSIPQPSRENLFSIKCRARNIGDAILPIRGCVEICGSEIAARGQNSTGIVVDVDLPGSENGIGLYGILNATITPGQIGSITVLGFAMATITGDATDSTTAGPVSEQTAVEAGGAFSLIWFEEIEGEGEFDDRKCLLFLGGGGSMAWEHVSEFPEIPDAETIIWFDPEQQPWGAGPDDTHWYPIWKFTDKTGEPGTS